jgi:SAM-dependent methyltransferase
VHLRERLRETIEGRQSYIKRNGLDPDIHLPGGNWELGGGLYEAFRTVLKGDYSVLNNLRLFCQNFTGFQLISLSLSEGKPFPREVPADLDDRLSVIAQTPLRCVRAYVEAIRHLPESLHITPPNRFGEIGWMVDGKIINNDTYDYLERVVLLAESGKLWDLRNRLQGGPSEPRPPSEVFTFLDHPEVPDDNDRAARAAGHRRPHILEIGSGYGGLAYHIKKLVPQARYFLVDIPESLLFSLVYLPPLFENDDNGFVTPENLEELHKDSPGFTFVPNFLFDHCCSLGREFDLVINTLSMAEMNEKQIRYYCERILVLLGGRGVFFEQNRDNHREIGDKADWAGKLDAQSVIAECLPLCIPLENVIMPLNRGRAHLWAGSPVPPYRWHRGLSQKPSPSDGAAQIAAAEAEELRRTIRAMESSKFWKLRKGWMRVKNRLRLTG